MASPTPATQRKDNNPSRPPWAETLFYFLLTAFLWSPVVFLFFWYIAGQIAPSRELEGKVLASSSFDKPSLEKGTLLVKHPGKTGGKSGTGDNGASTGHGTTDNSTVAGSSASHSASGHAVVPEPATLMLMAMGGGLLMLRRRKRR